MRGSEFIRRLKSLGLKTGVRVTVVARRGKGSHETLFYGDRFTIIPDRKKELKKGTVCAMLNQLGLDLKDI